jgi:demethylmenaquinone methyltransferase / 2-methoxy-6-polyprenyl-1,4-benzoquinol methylase
MSTDIEAVPADLATRAERAAMFDRIARRYDALNRIISFGLDRRWRRRAVAALGFEPDAAPRILDVACGTGDLMIEIMRQHPAARVIGIDPASEMLAGAERKAQRRGLDMELRLGVAEELAFDDGELDGVTIAFGLRNVADRAAGIAEMMRVLAPGGRLVILELTEPRGRRMAALARFHIHQLIPRLGALISGSRGTSSAYRYLERSIAAFPAPPQVAAELRAAGAERVFVEQMCFGAVHIFVACKPPRERAPEHGG